MRESHFFYHFFLSLMAQGLPRILTQDDNHHRPFASVAEYLNDPANSKEIEEAGLANLCFIPHPFTGRFPPFDTALLDAQRGLLSLQAPYFREAVFLLEPAAAQSLLDEEKCLPVFEKLGKAFIAASQLSA